MIFSSTFFVLFHLGALRSQIELKLKVKTEISLCMAIMQNNPLSHPYITQYGSTDIGMALVWPVLLRKSLSVRTSNKLNAYMCSKGTSG